MRGIFSRTALAGLLLAGATSAYAQNAQETKSTPDTPSAEAPVATTSAAGPAGDIIVTAQRRSERLLDVPLSISASTGDALQASGIRDLTDLKLQTPGFISLSGTGFTQIFIRGVGNSIFVGADPSVATFIDDVPRIYGTLIQDLVNVDRVEVLKGAQGGLYGRNATGGVVNIITRQPTQQDAMIARVSAGSFNMVNASAYVNVGLGDNVAANLSATRRYGRPYIRNIARRNPYPAGTTSFFGDPNSVATPGQLSNTDFYAFDGKVRLTPTDTVKITLAGDYNSKQDANGNANVNELPDVAYATYLFLAQRAGLTNVVGPFTRPPRGSSFGAIDQFSKIRDYGGSAKIEVGLPGVDVTSITAFRWNDSQFRGDIGASPVPLVGFQTDFHRRYVYQEVRGVSTWDGPFSLLGGATYFHDNIDSQLNGLFLGFPLAPTISSSHTNAYSVYGQASYELTTRLTLTGSLRYVSEKKGVDFPAQPPLPADDASTRNRKLIPSGTISYKTDGGTAYLRYAKGFKTGGINPIVRPDAFAGAPGSTFAPEVVNTYEAGYRSSFFGNKVQLTTAIFYNDYKNIQIAVAGNASAPQVTNAIINAQSARTYGAEGSLTWRLLPSLTVTGNLGYLNARYKNASYPGSPVVDPFSASGNRMALAPRWQGGATIALEQPLNDRLRLSGNIVYSYTSHFNFSFRENPAIEQPAYSLVNTRLGLVTSGDRVGAFIYVNNLFDKYYRLFGQESSVGAFSIEAQPRIIGGQLELKF